MDSVSWLGSGCVLATSWPCPGCHHSNNQPTVKRSSQTSGSKRAVQRLACVGPLLAGGSFLAGPDGAGAGAGAGGS